MDTLDTAEMRQRFQHRAEAVQYGSRPTGAGGEQAELDFRDFAMIADAVITFDGGILTIDLRPAISPTGFTDKRESETLAAMENIANAESHTRTYDDIMEAQREQRADRAREALIEDEDRPSMLKVVKTIEPIDVNACPGLDLTDSPVVRRTDDSDSPVVLPVVR